MTDLETAQPETNDEEIRGEFRYQQDSKRYHRFQIETDAGVVGTLYVPKDAEAIPQKIVLENAQSD